jgi:nucleoside-diphosphate-sugar epimerase
MDVLILGGTGFLGRHLVEPFMELPLWVPREYAGLLDVDCGRAIEAGLTFRPFVRDDRGRTGLGPRHEGG